MKTIGTACPHYTKKEIKALDDSINHWEFNVKKLSSWCTKYNNVAISGCHYFYIPDGGRVYYDNDHCPLCATFMDVDKHCERCPLFQIGDGCDNLKISSSWRAVLHSRTNDEILTSCEKMLSQLKKAREMLRAKKNEVK